MASLMTACKRHAPKVVVSLPTMVLILALAQGGGVAALCDQREAGLTEAAVERAAVTPESEIVPLWRFGNSP
ncbi:hypothetical protein [Micromonospora sp. MH33]|uniref:hypothetical protein n=1 Tax=Micromonospora sp. MH33 TaxID=1945509 RepID=UPI0011B1CCC2|nr:hypothetical protein [Micromonospora sp. MH33]